MFNDYISHELPVIGVDIGGTKISAGLIENNKLVKSYKLPTPAREEKAVILQTIIRTIRALGLQDYSGIGVGIPGLVDTKNGIVYDVQNIPSLTHVALKSELESVFYCKVEINNDANCFVLGSNTYGNGQQFKNMVGLTLGTGLGGGLILNGKLYEGVGTGAGEFGFLPYKDSILEHYCSGQFFQRQYNITGEEVSQKAIDGDAKALEMFSHFGHHLGEAIKMIVYSFAPEAVMLGGSVSKNFDFFKESMWKTIRDFPYNHVIDNLVILPATGSEIALVGAASLVQNKTELKHQEAPNKDIKINKRG